MNNKQTSQLIVDLLRDKLNQFSNQKNNNISQPDINNILNDSSGLSSIVEQTLNIIMTQDREQFINENKEYANGFYNRQINTSLDKLNLNVPRTRSSNFFPQLLTKYKRNDDSFYKLVSSLLYNGRSRQNIKQVIKDFNLNFSKNILDVLSDELQSKINDFKSTQLNENMPFVFIDAKLVKIKVLDKNDKEYGKVKKAAIYTVIGIDFDGSKQVLGFYINFGSENKAYWIKVFNDLISRGLSKVMLFISDDFPGISDAITSVFPNANPQKCLVHFMRNVKRCLGRIDASNFIKQFKFIKNNDSLGFDEAVNEFENLCNNFKDKNKTFFDYVLNKKEEYFYYTKYDKSIWKFINNTNIVENFNSVLEVLRRNLGGHFQSISTAEKSIFLVINKLHNNVWDRVNPLLKSAEYKVRQDFNLTFSD